MHPRVRVADLIPRDPQRFLEFLGEMLDFFEDFLRLFRQVVNHTVNHLGFAADQLERRNHKSKMIVHIVPQVCKSPIQVSHFFRAERHALAGQTHVANDAVACR